MERTLRNPLPYFEEFHGGAIPTTAAVVGYPWVLRDTSAAGAPTIAFATPTSAGLTLGELSFTMSATSEATVLGLDFNDVRSWNIDRLQQVEFGLRVNQTNNATTRLAFGVGAAYNADPQAQTAHCQFRLTGNNVVRIAGRDSASNVEQTTTTTLVANTNYQFVIDFGRGKSNIQFFVGTYGGPRNLVNTATPISVINSTDSLQPFILMTKASGTQTDAFVLDYVKAEFKR
jgi:hypothetical protein